MLVNEVTSGSPISFSPALTIAPKDFGMSTQLRYVVTRDGIDQNVRALHVTLIGRFALDKELMELRSASDRHIRRSVRNSQPLPEGLNQP